MILHKFMLDGHEYEAQFTLTDRSRFIYPVLLGRRFLEHAALVDPSRTYLRTSPPSKNKDRSNDSDVAKKTRSDNGKKAEQAIRETKADNNNAADKSDTQ
ncbi:MAG: RimK/LysX family protein [Gammaproteobacteria bacterium]